MDCDKLKLKSDCHIITYNLVRSHAASLQGHNHHLLHPPPLPANSPLNLNTDKKCMQNESIGVKYISQASSLSEDTTNNFLYLKGRWPRFQARAPPLSFLTIEGRAAAYPPLSSRLTSICTYIM